MCRPRLPSLPSEGWGFQVPWIGTWNNLGIIIDTAGGALAQAGVDLSQAWRTYYASVGHGFIDLILVEALREPTVVEDIIPKHLSQLVYQMEDVKGDARYLHELWLRWRNWRGGGREWVDPSSGPTPSSGVAHLSAKARGCKALWNLGAQAMGERLHFTCVGCGEPAPYACRRCDQPSCSGCPLDIFCRLPRS